MYNSDLIEAHVIFSGRVQGVFFRKTVRRHAVSFGLKGWVKNLEDRNKVEAIFEGKREDVKECINKIKNKPFLAKVLDIQIEIKSFQPTFKDFRIIF